LHTRVEVKSTAGWAVLTPGRVFSPAGRPLVHRPSYWLGHLPYWAAPCLACWSVATLALGLRSRLTAGHPGLAAGLAVLVALAVHGLRFLHYAMVSGRLSLMWRSDPVVGLF
jgi:hypothetical protein